VSSGVDVVGKEEAICKRMRRRRKGVAMEIRLILLLLSTTPKRSGLVKLRKLTTVE